MEYSPSWEAYSYSANQEFSTLCGTWSCLDWTLSWASWIQFSLSHPFSLRPVLIVSCHLNLGPQVVSSLQDFGAKFCTYFLFPSCTTNFILLRLIILIIFGKNTTYRAPHCAVFSSLFAAPSLLGPYILLGSTYCNSINLC